jgi:3-dehydroquinate synthase
MIISDSNVKKLYEKQLRKSITQAGTEDVAAVFFEAGEASKNLSTLGELLSESTKAELNRKSVIAALGGGVPGDIAGFTSAIFMRGIDFIQFPTSLLAMVDSSVGGKTGIDLPEGKNLAGAFWQPKAVVIDTEVLKTLPEREVKCGLAEIVKYAVILDEGLFRELEDNIESAVNLDLDFYASIIARCCELKASVVSGDERENGQRAILNYGHTFGHAIEAVAAYRNIAHGEAVSVGMRMAGELAVSLGLFSREDLERQNRLIEQLGLLTTIKGFDPAGISAAMKKDKKMTDGGLVFVLPEKIGKVVLERNIPEGEVVKAVGGYCE